MASDGIIGGDLFFYSSPFDPIGPKSWVTGHLDGYYDDSGTGIPPTPFIDFADISMTAIANDVAFAFLDPVKAEKSKTVVKFAPKDETKLFAKKGVTSLSGRITFQAGVKDFISLPRSARVSAVVPEPGTMLFLSAGLICLAGLGKKFMQKSKS